MATDCSYLYVTDPMYCLLDCKAPEQPSNGILKLTVDGVTTYGATATVSCKTGYELVGDGFVRCRADGIWSALPSCGFKGVNNTVII